MQLRSRVAVLALAGVFSQTAHAATRSEECFNYLKAQDYARAVQAGRQASRETPGSGDAFFCLGSAYRSQGDFDSSLRSLQQAERLFSGKNDLRATYGLLGMVAGDKGDLQQALGYHSRELALARDVGNRSAESAALNNIALVFSAQGDQDKALDYLQQSLRIEPDELAKATKYNNIATILSERGQHAQALENLDKAIALHRRAGNHHKATIALLNKGSVLIEANRLDEAETVLKEGLQAVRQVGDRFWEAVGLRYLGDLAVVRQRAEAALDFYKDALRLARQSGATVQAEQLARRVAQQQRSATAVSYGVVEIGSKGVKAAVVTSSRDEQGRTQYETGFRKSVNTNVIQGVAERGEFAPEAIDDTARAVAQLVAAIKASSPNVADHITVAGSSALSGAFNRADLAARIKAESGIEPVFITSAQELSYAIQGSIRSDLTYKTALLDIGSGNGRVGYMISPRGDRPAGQAVVDLRAGSVTLAELANKARNPGEDFVPALERVVARDIEPRLTAELKQYPIIRRHNYFLAVGGAAWAMTTLLYPQRQEAYVPLSKQDFRDYYTRLVQNADAVLSPDLGRIADLKVREKAQKQVESVRTVFTVENLLAGARLLKAVADADPFGTAEIYFAREGNWAYGLAESQALVRSAGR